MTHNPTEDGDPPSGRGEAALVRDGVEFTARDARLLREIADTGSVATASANLGRSRARALTRIEALESAFGALVDRRRGGAGGGGSRLTARATDLLNRYDRLQRALTATARVPETVLAGTVTAVAGELAEVRTSIGPMQGLHDGLDPGDAVQVRIGADAITVLDPAETPDPDATSARNSRPGTVAAVDRGETVHTVDVGVDDVRVRALLTEESAERLDIATGREVALTWKATATRLVPERPPDE
jgi:molybdate transport system regulatory protein